MRTFAISIAAAVLLLTGCSTPSADELPEEGCWITQASGVDLASHVEIPSEGAPVAMNPGDSYEIRCAREIIVTSVGKSISEDQKLLRIDSLPDDRTLKIETNERDVVYRGQPSSSSENIWNSLEEASNTPTNYWFFAFWVLLVLAVIAVVLLIRRRRSDEPDVHRDVVDPF